MGQAKKEKCISKNKPLTASARIKSFMAAPGGFESELAQGVAQSLNQMKKKEDETAGAVKKEAQAEQRLQQQENVIQQVEERRLKHEISEINGKIPSSTKIMVALIIAVFYDIINYVTLIASLFTGGVSSAGDAAGDIVMNALFLYLLGPYYMKSRPRIPIIGKLMEKVPIPAPLWEFIPGLDLWPTYIDSVLQTRKKIKGAAGELKELTREEKMLRGGGMKKPGFLGVSGTIWAVILTVLVFVSMIAVWVGGLAGLIVPGAIFAVIFFLIMLQNEDTRGTAIMMGVILLVILVFGSIFVFLIAPMFSGFGGPLGDSMSSMASIPTKIGDWWSNHNPVTAVKNYYKKQVLLATGDYYTGKVDENSKAPLGVFLEEIKQADPVFYTDRPVMMYANLKVLTLDEPVNVTINCKDDKAVQGTAPKIYPRDQFIVDTYEEQSIDCMFDAGSINKGSSVFTISADFNFKTMGYSKTYFMDGERLRSMRRDEIDPLDQYGITDKNPSAIYTNGPVGIGMGVGKPPVGIDLEQAYTPMTFGITLENKWEGKIRAVNRFIVILPKGFVLEEIGVPRVQINCEDLKYEEKSLCDDELNNVYSVTDSGFVEVDRGNFKSYRAYLRVNQADYEKVLGKVTPISTKYFKVIIDYTYRLEKTKTIEVKSRQTQSLGGLVGGVEGGGTDTTPPTANVKPLINLSASSVKISWTTDEDSIDQLEWWEVLGVAHYGTPNEVGFAKEHSRTIEGVAKGKEYYYQITSTDAVGNSKSIQRPFSIS